jgi:rhamnosyltransferase
MDDCVVPPTICVLLATYNGAAYCEDQITSLLWQRDVDVHLYVRDDGSQDGTVDIVERLADRYPDRITMVDNHGIRTGSATGSFFALLTQVDLARHAYAAFADQDDVWMPDKLVRAVASMAVEQADGYSSDLIAYHQERNAAWMLHKKGDDADLDYLFQGASAGCTYVLSAKAAQLVAGRITAAPPLCPGASHDWIIYAICRSAGLTWCRDSASGIVYRQHASNLYGAQQGWGDILAKFRLTRSGWYRTHILWLRNVVRGQADELRVLSAVERGGMADRWWLIGQAGRFRRTFRSVLSLRAAILSGAV